MSVIVGVHGINQHLKGAEVLHQEWVPALIDGVAMAGGQIAATDLVCAFYGSLFRPAGKLRAIGGENYHPNDLTDDEAELLIALWEHGALIQPERVVAPGAALRGTPAIVQSALGALSRSSFFSRVAESAFIGALKQVRRYMRESDLRIAAQETVHAQVTPYTKVLVGHSLGSVVAYEALERFRGEDNWANVSTLVTLGSPLGIRNLIFDALIPPPVNGVGVGPSVQFWTNISDDGDVVALEKRLGPKFVAPGVDIAIDNGAHVHDIGPYLTAKETGAAIYAGTKVPYVVDPVTDAPIGKDPSDA